MSHRGLIIYERVDRMPCNDRWRFQFPDAHVKELTRLDFSDHHPGLVSLINNISINMPKYFKFERTRVLVDSYQDMLKTTWNINLSLKNNLEKLKIQVTNWNMYIV